MELLVSKIDSVGVYLIAAEAHGGYRLLTFFLVIFFRRKERQNIKD